MTNTDTSDYPSWRKALFGEDTVANLLCFVKWVLWQGLYAILAVAGLVLVGCAWVIDKVANVGATAGATSIVQSSRTKTIASYLWKGFLVLYGIYIVAVLAQFFYSNPMGLVFILAGVGAIVVTIAVGLFVHDVYGDQIAAGVQWIRSALGRGHERAAETPGVRRVVGRCPVSLTIEPKWFDKLFGRFTP